MTLRWLLAALHLLALGIGVAAIWGRAQALRHPPDRAALERAFRADAVWGAAALLWISTGLLRAFGPWEKGGDYYLGNHIFWAKMGLLGLILLLEVRPMVTLIRWRIAAARGVTIETGAATMIHRISVVQTVLVMAMVLAATAMARGFGIRS